MTNLSPAAQAVRNAVDHYETNHWLTPNQVAAAALRALAEYRTPHWDGTGPACHWHPTPYARRELLAIADELES
jgi:hypothetical protein